ncbi:hypothetical protein [Jannaschia helgolandensis]|uniref:hypothetical protein n=1 Tax=Jannaschia helgolandensis TaxID=188906 RepID=UPI0030DC02F1|tara:strand:- start:263 stop:1048 length:786 start_codon:yes stop_codon:yes gene_type:complete
MLGWKLFLRAVMLIIDNLGDALRLSAVPYLLVVAVTVWLSVSYPEWIGATGFDPDNMPPAGFLGGQMLVLLANMTATIWIAVNWHRYVLLSETFDGWMPAFRGPEMLGYLGRSLLVGVIMLLGIFLTSLVINLVVGMLAPPLAGVLAGTGGLFVGMILFYRLALVLPAGAIGQPITLSQSLEETRNHVGTVLVLAILTVGFTLMLQLPALIDGGGADATADAGPGIITVIYQLVIGWIGLILGVGTLTALYGHLVEGRPVD